MLVLIAAGFATMSIGTVKRSVLCCGPNWVVWARFPIDDVIGDTVKIHTSHSAHASVARFNKSKIHEQQLTPSLSQNLHIIASERYMCSSQHPNTHVQPNGETSDTLNKAFSTKIACV